MTTLHTSTVLLLCVCGAFATSPAITQRHGQTPAQVDDRTRRVAGCYQLTLGKWSAGSDTSARPEHALPARFRLDSLGRSGFPASYYQIAPSSGTGALNIDAWHWIDSTRLTITWSANTLSGSQLELRVTGDSLVGDASSFGELDVLSRRFPTATAVARRAPCRPPQSPDPTSTPLPR